MRSFICKIVQKVLWPSEHWRNFLPPQVEGCFCWLLEPLGGWGEGGRGGEGREREGGVRKEKGEEGIRENSKGERE